MYLITLRLRLRERANNLVRVRGSFSFRFGALCCRKSYNKFRKLALAKQAITVFYNLYCITQYKHENFRACNVDFTGMVRIKNIKKRRL